MKALADHGELGPILPADGGDCEEVLAQFAKAGIDIDALAAQLQDEGAKSFVKSWNELMAVIASKSAALAKAARCSRHARNDSEGDAMNVLVVDVGGTHVKILATGQERTSEVCLGPTLTAEQMVAGVKKLAGDWKYDVVSIGYPGPVLHGRPVAEPHNLGPGGSGSTSKPRSGARSRSSMMRPCRPWGATRAARCSSWAWGPVSVPP